VNGVYARATCDVYLRSVIAYVEGWGLRVDGGGLQFWDQKFFFQLLLN